MTAKKNNDEKKYLVLAEYGNELFVTADGDNLTPYTKAEAEEAIESLLVDHDEDDIFIYEISKKCSFKKTISIKEIE